MISEKIQIGPTLRAWRDRLSPVAAGLPLGNGRRASGLRREELSDLAGISVDYLVRLEQGRAENPSASVVGALAAALRLTDEERDHLYRLARLAPPAEAEISDELPPGVQRILNRLGDTPVAVFAADWQLIWWNHGWTALHGDPTLAPPKFRNFARNKFSTDISAPRLSLWPVSSSAPEMVERAIVSDLRRATGRFPNSRRLSELIEELTTSSALFAALWASGHVGAHREDHKVVEHPAVGPITVDCDVMSDGDAELKIVITTVAPGTEDENRFRKAFGSL